MTYRWKIFFGIGSVLLAVPVAAFATPLPVRIPEPATVTLVAAGLGAGVAAHVLKKWMRPK